MLAVILAGGKGVRMLPLTKEIPKAMVKLKGKPLLEWILLELRDAGIEKLVIVVGYKKEKIIEYFGKSFAGLPITYVEQKRALGTAHALLQARDVAKSEKQFIACHGDVIAKSADIRRLINAEGKAVVALRLEKNAERFGVIEVKHNKIVSIVEKPKGIKEALVNAGLYKFDSSIFELLSKLKRNKARNEYELTDALKKLAEKNELRYIIMKQKVLDIGTIQDLENAEKA
ncbi:MAG: NTP transferase domain-containing protein [Candidatus Diapherotrites archaeon]|nr:NTP transferase domain-containing protein [Candidatus Diapherotrites archaeon]